MQIKRLLTGLPFVLTELIEIREGIILADLIQLSTAGFIQQFEYSRNQALNAPFFDRRN